MKVFLRFDPAEGGGKTGRWIVVSATSGQELGAIRWYSPWRRYCFFPLAGALFDTACLGEIVAFITNLMAER